MLRVYSPHTTNSTEGPAAEAGRFIAEGAGRFVGGVVAELAEEAGRFFGPISSSRSARISSVALYLSISPFGYNL